MLIDAPILTVTAEFTDDNTDGRHVTHVFDLVTEKVRRSVYISIWTRLMFFIDFARRGRSERRGSCRARDSS